MADEYPEDVQEETEEASGSEGWLEFSDDDDESTDALVVLDKDGNYDDKPEIAKTTIPKQEQYTFDWHERCNVKLDESFDAKFSDPYGIRGVVDYFHIANIKAILLKFTSDGIEACERGGDVYSHIQIKSSNLTQYRFVSEKESICLGLPMDELRPLTSSISKKVSLVISKKEDDMSCGLEISDRGQTSVDDNANCGECSIINIPGRRVIISVWNVRVCTTSLAELNNTCTAFLKYKVESVRVTVYRECVVFGVSAGPGRSGRTLQHGKLYPNEEPKFAYDIRAETLKQIAKANSLSANGIAKIYAQNRYPLRLRCPLGLYGKIDIFIHNSSMSD